MAQNTNNTLVKVEHLKKYFPVRAGVMQRVVANVLAVDDVSFSIQKGETLGLVGESGSGKSMTCLSLLRLVPRPAARILGGQVWLDGEDLLAKTEAEMRKIRGRRISHERTFGRGPDRLKVTGNPDSFEHQLARKL